MEKEIEQVFFDYYGKDIEAKLDNGDYTLKWHFLNVYLNKRYSVTFKYDDEDSYIISIVRYPDPVEYSRSIEICDTLKFGNESINISWLDKVNNIIKSVKYKRDPNDDNLNQTFSSVVLSDIRKEKIDKIIND